MRAPAVFIVIMILCQRRRDFEYTAFSPSPTVAPEIYRSRRFRIHSNNNDNNILFLHRNVYAIIPSRSIIPSDQMARAGYLPKLRSYSFQPFIATVHSYRTQNIGNGTDINKSCSQWHKSPSLHLSDDERIDGRAQFCDIIPIGFRVDFHSSPGLHGYRE